jgi:hypothetical protein
MTVNLISKICEIGLQIEEIKKKMKKNDKHF